MDLSSEPEQSKLIAWQCTPAAPLLKSAGQDRDWMDQADQRFPYRCLPLVIANSLGWDVLNPVSFTAIWNGGMAPQDVVIQVAGGQSNPLVQAHFGVGVLTFTLGHLFQTPPGMNLWVKGPPNTPKDGIIALEGVVETDWCPATFTMNYLFTRKNHPVTFSVGESYCRIIPIPRYITEKIQPEIRMLGENQTLNQHHLSWRSSRDHFNRGLKQRDADVIKQKWQKDYFKGGGKDRPIFPEHQTRLHQQEFQDHRPESIQAQDLVPQQNLSLREVIVTVSGGKPVVVRIPNLF